MKTILMRVVVGAVASVLLGGIAIAQNAEEVKVQATRVVNTKVVGYTSRNVPIVDISLSYGVSVADLDLTSSAGASELEKRVGDAALAACKEISRQYPTARPDDKQCAKAATDEAMVKVRELVAAAHKAPGK